MTRLLLILLFACGGAANAPVVETTPKSPTAGDLKIVMTVRTKNANGEGEIVIAADGTYSAKVSTNGAAPKARTGKLIDGSQLLDDQGKSFARIGDDNTVSVLHETEHRENGKLVKSEATWTDVGTLDADGTFTAKRDGSKISVDGDGNLVGFPMTEMTFKVTAGLERKRIAVFLVVAILAGGKTVMDGSGPVSVPAVPQTTN